MQTTQRIERALQNALQGNAPPGCPPTLSRALRHAVIPGGARIRPKLCLSVAQSLGDPYPARADAAAAAIELLHCASLVHDDLPCFDDAAQRRGRPSVHRAFGEPVAVLAGDALIVLAFETVARGAADAPGSLARLVLLLTAAVGVPNGLCAGQGWEQEPHPDLGRYHRAKTGALFAAATAAGAEAAGRDGNSWRRLGECIGEAYQVADDLKDVICGADELGKPAGQDTALGRPNAALELGARPALGRLRCLVEEALSAVPDGPGADALRRHILAETERLVPVRLASQVA
ncbi:MAG: polyprenyl synthetase family protein [Pseudomonadales bacterium]